MPFSTLTMPARTSEKGGESDRCCKQEGMVGIDGGDGETRVH